MIKINDLIADWDNCWGTNTYWDCPIVWHTNSAWDYPWDDGKDYVKKINLAGTKKEDIKVTLDNGTIKVEVAGKLKEYYTPSKSKQEKLDWDKISCKYDNGLLIITVPILEAKKSQEVKID